MKETKKKFELLCKTAINGIIGLAQKKGQNTNKTLKFHELSEI